MCEAKTIEIVDGLTAKAREVATRLGWKLGRHEDGSIVAKTECPRCGGSGHYSRCETYGTRCFGCDVASGGTAVGFVWANAEKLAKKTLAAERKAARVAKVLDADRAAFAALAGFVSYDDLEESGRVLSFKRAEAKAAAAAAAKAAAIAGLEFVGEIGEKLSIEATVASAFVVPGMNLGYKVLTSTLVKFHDASGNVFVWFSSAGFDAAKVGSTVKLVGTVKAHRTYEKTGERQTILTRCKIG